jgi:hypothetical protein
VGIKLQDQFETIVQSDDPFAHCLRKRVSKSEAIRRWGKVARAWMEVWTDEGLWTPLHDYDLNFVGYGLTMPDTKPISFDKQSLLDLRTTADNLKSEHLRTKLPNRSAKPGSKSLI